MDKARVKKAIELLLEAIGEDPKRSGLTRTPERVADMYAEIFSGLDPDPEKLLETTHELRHEEMVLVKDIPLYGVCEHHLLPFFGKASIAYIPKDDRVAGFSALAKAVDALAKKPTLQEKLVTELADLLMKKLKPRGALVIVEGRHLCLEMIGAKKPGAKTITSAVRGIFEKNQATRAEALSLIKG